MQATLILSGKSGSGKDTFALMLKEILAKYNKNVIIIHYADVLKYFLKEFYGWNGIKDEQGRSMLQKVGTDLVRTNNPDYWANVVVQFLKAIENDEHFYIAIIPDARFENEASLAISTLKNTSTIRINRINKDGSEWINPNLTEEQIKHPSETSMDDFGFDYLVHNDEDIESLRLSAETLLKDLKLI